MSTNEAIQGEKNIKALAMINKTASEFIKAENRIKKEKLYAKLWEKCLGFVLRSDISQQDDDVRTDIKNRLMANEERLEDSNHDLRKTFNKDVFIETITYAIKAYSENPGEEFTRLFLSTYAIRNKANVGIESFKQRMCGFSFSENDRKMWHAFNKLIDSYATQDARFAGKQLHMLSKEDIHNVLEAAGVGFKDEARYAEIARQFANTQCATELDSTVAEDSDTKKDYSLADESDVENDVVGQIYLVKLFSHAIEMASGIQQRYFACFITLDIFNYYPRAVPDEMTSCLDSDFMRYINDYIQTNNKSINVLPDAVIADYLKVQKPAVTKQRANYKAVLNEARKMLGD